MARAVCVSLLVLLGVSLAADAWAQGAPEIPIERDLRRERRIERRLEALPDQPGANASPDNPDGVVGFDGPPNDGINAVITGGPLPPGSPSNPD